MSLPSKVRKAKGGENSQTTGKPLKTTDSKQDVSKQSEKSQPTAEQMRIAQIIDTKTEDPALKEKLKQVMDATQKSMDEVYTALHDCDHDPNRAVNLLLEGIESEWSTSSKKKKNRASSDKAPKEKEPPQELPPEDDPWDPSPVSKPIVGNKGAPPRGRGRGFRGGRGNSNFNNNEQNDRGRRGKVLNGPSRGRGNRGRIQTRGFGRGRATFRRPIDTWDPQRPISSSLNHDTNSEDWDNEEYTGSLANSQIYTSSGTGNTPPAMNNSVIVVSNSSSPNEYDKKNQIQIDSNSVKPLNNLSHKQPTDLSSLTISFKQYSSIPSMPEPAITPPMGVRSPPMGANLIMLPPRADRPPISNQEIRMQRPRPKIPPPSKIPATAVEMPPDSVESNIGLLDVQFGVMELNEASTETVQVSPPTPHHSPSPAPSDKLLPHQSVSTSDALLLNETSFSPVRNTGSNSLSQISDLTSKVTDVASSLYQESSYQTSPYSKTAQQSPSVYSSTYSSGQKAWLNISTGSEETAADDTTHEPEEWKLLTSSAPTISVPFNDFENADNDVSMRTVLSTGAQQLAVEEQHEQEEQEEEVITPPSRTEVNSTSSIIYSTSSSQSTYSSSTGGVYGGISSSYPQYQYNNYPSQQNQSLPILTNSSNSYQSALGNLQYGSNTQSVYGTSGLPTPSYTTPYQTYNSTVQHNHKQTLLSSSSTNSKEFETSQTGVNLSSISHSGSINPTPTLLSASQTTPTSKPTSMSSMGKSTVVANMPPGVPPLVGAQYIMGQGSIPYFQQPMYYEDLQLMSQQRLAPHISTGYYEMGYPASTTREGVQYNMNDGRFARADNTSPVQASSISQQSGSQAHQQPMMNPTAIPQAYAYFYGGSMIPGNFQYGAPTLYPMAAGGTTGGHGSTNSGVYGKGPNNFTGNYGGNYENNQGSSSVTSSDFKTSTSSGPKAQSTQSTNPSSNSDLVNMYSKSLSKSYEKQGFHCATPPPFNLGSQNSGIGPGGGYPQHLFIPAMTPHHNTTTLMHQPIHQDGTNTMSGRSQGGTQQPKVVMTKANYSSSTYWTQN